MIVRVLSMLLWPALIFADNDQARTVNVTVLQENGEPLPEAKVEVIFLGTSSKTTQRIKGLSNIEGKFEAVGRPSLRIHINVNKEGFYPTTSGRLSRKKNHNLEYVLREIVNPIGLYAKRLRVTAPILGEEFAYDCEAGDWVAPHGKGVVPDIIFEVIVHRNNNEYLDIHYEAKMSFPNEGDGLVKFVQNKQSGLKSPREADAAAEYKPSWTNFTDRKQGRATRTNSDPNGGYVFRLRTKKNAQGEILSCNYAKAYGDIPDLKIYFNPTPNDRNLEFDPEQNLFKDLKFGEQVREP